MSRIDYNEQYIKDIKDGKIRCYELIINTLKNYPKFISENHNSDISLLTLKRLYVLNKRFSIEALNSNTYWITCRDMTLEEETYIRALAVMEIERKRQERLNLSNNIIERFESKIR